MPMIAVPLLLRPKLLGIRNRWRVTSSGKGSAARDGVILLLGFAMMLGIYWGTVSGLLKVREFSHLAYLSPFVPLAIIFMFLGIMLIISATVTALGSLFFSRDLELVLAAPVSPLTFFFGRFAYVLFSSAWMPIIFIAPFLAAYGRVFHAGLSFYLIAFAAIIPYFVIPAAVAVVLATFLTLVIPAKHTREVLTVVVILFLAGIYLIADLIGWGSAHRNDITELLKFLSVISFPDALWLPSHGVAIILREALDPSGRSVLAEFMMLYSTAIGMSALAYICCFIFHELVYTKACNNRKGVMVESGRWRKHFLSLTSRFSPEYRAFVGKEFKIFSRDMTQSVQLLLLLGVYLIYLYNLKILRGIQTLPPVMREKLETLAFIINVAMAAFVTTAVCTRCVFSSISLEGPSFWVVQSSPVSIAQTMRLKFWCWFPSVGLISSVIFASGAIGVGAETSVVMISFVSGWLLSYGIVGAAIGLGATFAFFQWEHSSQLVASFGNFVFMLVSIGIITLNMIPIGILSYLARPDSLAQVLPQSQWFLLATGCVLSTILVNLGAKDVLMRAGHEALEKQLS